MVNSADPAFGWGTFTNVLGFNCLSYYKIGFSALVVFSNVHPIFLQKIITTSSTPSPGMDNICTPKTCFETKNIVMRSVRVSVPKNPEPSQSNRIEGSNPILTIGM